MENLIYKILKYHFKECNLIELHREIDTVKNKYHLNGVKPIQNNLDLFKVAMIFYKEGASEALGKLLYLLKK